MINKYRKKPIEIEAVQFTKDNFDEIKEFTNGKADHFHITRPIDDKANCVIDTLEGPMGATEDDFIIKGLKGEYYACKPDVFEKTYDKIN